MCLSFASCQQDPASTGGAKTSEEIKTVDTALPTVSEEKEELLELPSDAFFQDYEFRIIGLDNGDYSNIDLVAEDIQEEPINDAVYERNNELHEKYGITITAVNEKAANIVSNVKNNVSAQTDAYDLVSVTMSDAFKLARDGCLYNLYDFEYIDLTKSWWDQNVPATMTIKDKLYFTTGDISILDDDVSMVQLFNKESLAEKAPELDIYQMVRDRKWTLDALATIVKDLNDDTNGNGTPDKEDFWGMCLSTADVATFYNASGEIMIAPNDEGGFAFDMENARAMEVMGDILDFMLDNQFFRTDQLNATAADQLNFFMEGTIVFRSTVMRVARQLRPMEMDFGLLPTPLYDEDQERYYTPTSYSMIGYCIPTTVEDMDRAGIIVEAMAYYSKKHLTPAYYDVSLDGLLTRDDESKEMLDIIFASKVYDMGYLFNIGGQQRMMRGLVEQNNKAYASKYDEIRDIVNGDIEDILASFEF